MRSLSAVISSLLLIVFTTSQVQAAWVLERGEPSPEAGICMLPTSAIRLEENLRDYDTLLAKWDVAQQEAARLRLSNQALERQVVAMAESDTKNREALIRADEREKIRSEVDARVRQVIEMNSQVMGNSVAFMQAQQEEIKSLRKERLWFMIFGGVAAIMLGIVAIVK